jgi:hypothetical protein
VPSRRIPFRQRRYHPLTEQGKIDTETNEYLRAGSVAFADQPEEEVFDTNIGMA